MLKRRMDTAVRHPKVYPNNSELIMFVSSKNYKLKSFTLIELLVVISVIGLLSSIVLVSTKGIREKARIAKTLEFSQSLQNALGSEAVAIWNFDEGSGIIARDSSGNGNNGTLVGGAIFSSDTPHSVVGTGGGKYSLSLNSSNDLVNTTYSGGDLVNWTMEAWIYDVKQAGFRAIIQVNAAIDDALYIYPGNELGFWPCGGVGSVPANQWVHVAATYSNNLGFKYFMNGKIIGTTGTCPDATDWDFVKIGSIGPGDSESFRGYIDNVRIYNQVLTIGEIQQHYAEGLENHQNFAIK